MAPKVSVLVPIYNVELYLRQCLDSVVSQTLKDLEIICVNDGSSDRSLDIVKEYASRDSRVVILDKENSGYGDSLNAALDIATGEYIGIVESDDWAESNMFAYLYGLASAERAEVVKSNYFSYYSSPEWKSHNKSVTYLVTDDHGGKAINPLVDDQSIFFQQPAIWSAIYSRAFLVDKGIRFLPTPGASYQDTSFGFKVWSQVRRAVFTRNPFLHYRRDNEASSVHSPGKALNVVKEYAEIRRYLVENGLYDDLAALVHVCKWGAYRWNIDRLDPDVAGDFIALAAEEFRRAIDENEPVFRRCDVNQARGILELVERPEMLVQRRRAQERAVVSVVVPVYNAGEYLEPCLASVREQTLSDIEIVIVDDGSTDESIEYVEAVYAADPRVQLISQANRGVSSARNVGIEAAHGEWITFIDCDDFYEGDALQRMYAATAEEGIDLVAGSIAVHFEPGTRTAVDRFADQQYYNLPGDGKRVIDERLLKEMDSSACNKMFRLDKIESHNIRFPVGLRYEDAYFTDLYSWLSEAVFVVPSSTPVYHYRRRSGSIMNDTFCGSPRAVDHLDVGMRLLDGVEEFGLGEKLGKYYLWRLEQYLGFALCYSPAASHERIWTMFSEWLHYHRPALADLGVEELQHLESLVPAEFRRQGTARSARRAARERLIRVAVGGVAHLPPPIAARVRITASRFVRH